MSKVINRMVRNRKLMSKRSGKNSGGGYRGKGSPFGKGGMMKKPMKKIGKRSW